MATTKPEGPVSGGQPQPHRPAHLLPLFEGLLPINRARIPAEVVAGVTLAALGIPEVMGYAKIAGVPVVLGLYTLVLPVLVFAVLGSSRHLVVGADSATAAILAAGLAGMAAVGSTQYVELAGVLAILSGLFLVAARLIRLGFLADFLSRTVLIGFLTGVGVQVACGQVAGMLGVKPGGNGVRQLSHALSEIGSASATTMGVSAAVIVVILGVKMLNPKIPGALIAVIGAILVSWLADLSAHGVSTLGHVPGGLPHLGVPDVSWHQLSALVPTALSLFVVILAQSAATSRAYAARYGDSFDENVDLIGLGVANAAAGFSGTFVVNGSPTKTQMVDGAGGRSQLAQLATGAIVVVVLLFLTGPLEYLPNAVLASVVFLIGVELIDVRGMRKIYKMRLAEFVVASITAAVVISVGVKQGILVAIVLSLIEHVRHSYNPNDTLLVRAVDGNWKPRPLADHVNAEPGLVVYRFGASLYYANANRLAEEIDELTGADEHVSWVCMEASAIADVDYSGGDALVRLRGSLEERHVRLVFAELAPGVRQLLDRYGVTELVGADGFFDTVDDVVTAFRAR